jgi:hypothetical protein
MLRQILFKSKNPVEQVEQLSGPEQVKQEYGQAEQV